MQIIIDTAGLDSLTALERGVLELLLGQPVDKPMAKKAPAKKAPAKKATPPSPPTPPSAPSAPSPEEPEPAAAEEDEEGPTLDAAVARATALVADGKQSQVKAALKTVGAKRVSELKPSNIEAFLEALDG